MLGVPKGRSAFQIAVHQIRTPQNDERTYQHLPIYFSHLPIILEVHEAMRQTGHMTIMKLLILMHVIGTVLGVGAATFAEIFYTRFNSDNIITDDERKTLSVTYTIMRTGLFLLVISGFGFLLYFRLTEHVGIFSSPSF